MCVRGCFRITTITFNYPEEEILQCRGQTLAEAQFFSTLVEKSSSKCLTGNSLFNISVMSQKIIFKFIFNFIFTSTEGVQLHVNLERTEPFTGRNSVLVFLILLDMMPLMVSWT